MNETVEMKWWKIKKKKRWKKNKLSKMENLKIVSQKKRKKIIGS